jgi:hypothetical protein
MDVDTARHIAHYSHLGQRTPRGVVRIDHIERVAAGVSEEARAVAFLHDVLEHTDTDGDELLAHGLTQVESAALALLTRAPGESYELHALRIVHAGGPEGRLAREVKLADLDDHLRDAPYEQGDPPYAWARHHVVSARRRRDLEPPVAAPAAAS